MSLRLIANQGSITARQVSNLASDVPVVCLVVGIFEEVVCTIWARIADHLGFICLKTEKRMIRK
jgi:hypothetical protein